MTLAPSLFFDPFLVFCCRRSRAPSRSGPSGPPGSSASSSRRQTADPYHFMDDPDNDFAALGSLPPSRPLTPGGGLVGSSGGERETGGGAGKARMPSSRHNSVAGPGGRRASVSPAGGMASSRRASSVSPVAAVAGAGGGGYGGYGGMGGSPSHTPNRGRRGSPGRAPGGGGLGLGGASASPDKARVLPSCGAVNVSADIRPCFFPLLPVSPISLLPCVSLSLPPSLSLPLSLVLSLPPSPRQTRAILAKLPKENFSSSSVRDKYHLPRPAATTSTTTGGAIGASAEAAVAAEPSLLSFTSIGNSTYYNMEYHVRPYSPLPEPFIPSCIVSSPLCPCRCLCVAFFRSPFPLLSSSLFSTG